MWTRLKTQHFYLNQPSINTCTCTQYYVLTSIQCIWMITHCVVNPPSGLILRTWRGKAIFPWQRAPLWGICKFLLGLLKGHQGKDQGQRRQLPPLPPLNIRPAPFKTIWMGLNRSSACSQHCSNGITMCVQNQWAFLRVEILDGFKWSISRRVLKNNWECALIIRIFEWYIYMYMYRST